MRNSLIVTLAALGAAPLLASCSQDSESFDAVAYQADVLEWRAGRLEKLLAPTGYLTLAGLFWLDPGIHSFGSDPANDVVFPSAAAMDIGEFQVSDAGIRMNVAEDVAVFNEDERVGSILISDDTTEHPIAIHHETLGWTTVKRDGRFAVRLRDFEHPALESFAGLPFYEVDPDWRVTATLRRYAEPRKVAVATVIEGLGWNPESPGIVEFEIAGTTYELEAYESGDNLFFVFGDATSRDETYGAGRFLYADLPGEDGLTVLDFNRAYSPPCAFNDFATCPVASPRNRLPVRIEAGEKYDPSLHFGSDH